MNIFKRCWSTIHLFFAVDCPAFWDKLSKGQKGCLGCLGVILVYILCSALFICAVVLFVLLMCSINSDKRYELLHPAEEISCIEIIHIEKSVGLYSYPVDSIASIPDEHTAGIISLENSQLAECAKDLTELSASMWWNDPHPVIRDGTLLITYRDGSREWICADGTFYYDRSSDESNMTWYFFNDEEFIVFLEKYGYREP